MSHNLITSDFLQSIKKYSILTILLGLYFFSAAFAEAASLGLTPGTGVYAANGTFSVKVIVNTGGQSVNAADGTISFNPKELSVVSVNRSSSIFNLWVAEPSYSNSAGTISFSGGSPSGYSGSVGTIMTVTFRAAGAGTARVNFKNGSVLANDGRGTNILSSMNGGTYTIQPQTATPEPEIIEYVAPANTPTTPNISSLTHPDSEKWYPKAEAKLEWSLPSDITAIRTLLDNNPTTIPTKVYDNPIKSITLSDLSEGVSYFHLQFQNANGWGRVAHFRLAVDTENPQSIDITQPEDVDLSNPEQTLFVTVEDKTSGVNYFKVKVDAEEPYEAREGIASGTVKLPSLEPGYHTAIIEAFDQAGNSIVGTYSFTISSFDKPYFTEYPSEINEEVIPVIKGMTKPGASVHVVLSRVGGEPNNYTVTANEKGEFIFIPEGTFRTGVYKITAQATDSYGAKSELSEPISIAVQQPGYLRIGSLIVSVLSVLIPLLLLLVLLSFGIWYLFMYARRFRRRVQTESVEALEILRREFTDLQLVLKQQEEVMIDSRRTKKLTKAETELVGSLGIALKVSQQKVEKEIKDITNLTQKKE